MLTGKHELSLRLGFTALIVTRWDYFGSLSEEQGTLMNPLGSSNNFRHSHVLRDSDD